MRIEQAANTVLQHWNIEVDQQTERFRSQTEVCDDLGLVNRQQFLDGFQFHNHSIVDEQIYPEIHTNSPTFVFQRNRSLAFIWEASQAKFHGETVFVNAFQ